jgi:hypothetical protein
VIVTIAYVIVVSTGDAAYARYRVPIVPLLALLAANGVRWSVRRLRSRGRQLASSPAPTTRDAEAVPDSSA